MNEEQEQEQEPEKKRASRSVATQLVNLVRGVGEMFHSPEGDLYATIILDKRVETFSLTDRPFRDWLAHSYYLTQGRSANGGAIADAVGVLCGLARVSKKTISAYTRIASLTNVVYLDMARDDRKVLRIDTTGWKMTDPPEDVRFVRRSGLLPLPDPVRGDSLESLLPRVINVAPGSSDLMLLIGWLVGALRGLKPFPVLVLIGEPGSGKSCACRFSRRCIDPSQANMSLTPKEPRDLLITTRNSYILGFDNLSKVPDWFSDVLCSISTGAGFRTRTLTTDASETIFSAARPVLMNSVADIVRRGDLMDRALTVTLEKIDPSHVRTELEIDTEFVEIQPAILAGLADAVSQALREPVKLKRLPRMADFATVVESAAPALRWKPGEFLEVYAERRSEAAESVLDGDLVAGALKLMHDDDQGRPWLGTSDQLLNRLVGYTKKHRRAEDMPRSPRGLVGWLRRLCPALRGIGIDVKLPKRVRIRGKLAMMMSSSYPKAQGNLDLADDLDPSPSPKTDLGDDDD